MDMIDVSQVERKSLHRSTFWTSFGGYRASPFGARTRARDIIFAQRVVSGLRVAMQKTRGQYLSSLKIYLGSKTEEFVIFQMATSGKNREVVTKSALQKLVRKSRKSHF